MERHIFDLKKFFAFCFIFFLLFSLIISSCSNASNSGGEEGGASSGSFGVRTVFYSQETGYLTVYTDVADGVEFKLTVLNSTLASRTSNGGKLTFDCLLVLQREVVPSGTEFTVRLAADGYSSSYTYKFVHQNAAAGDTSRDSDSDGIPDWYEINRYGTDPYSDDTDGDNWTDFEELSMFDPVRRIFDPRIADLPKMEVEISDDFTVSYKYTIGTSEQKTSNVSKTEGYTHTESSGYTNSSTSSATQGWNAFFEIGYSWATEHPGVTIKGGGGAHGDYTKSSTYSMIKSVSESSSTTYSDGKAYTNGETRTITTGIVATYVTLKNTSNIAYTLKNLELTLNKLKYSGADASNVTPLTTYKHTSDITLNPGESSRITMSVEVSVGAYESIVNDKSCLNVAVSGYDYELSRVNKLVKDNFTEAVTKVMAKCAFVRVDYGPERLSTGKIQPEERYWISTKCFFNPDARGLDSLYKNMSLYDALTKVAGFSEDQLVLNDNAKIYSIRNRKSNSSHKDGDWYILKRYEVGDVEYQEMFNEYLVKNSNTDIVESTGTVDYNLKEIFLDAGANYLIFYDVDKDEDYVPLNQELEYGSDDNKSDTDGDTISDFYEIYGWRRQTAPNKFFYTDPTSKDTDGDGFDDFDDEEPCVPFKSKEATISTCVVKSVTDNKSYDITQQVVAIQSSDISTLPEINVYDGIEFTLRSCVVYNELYYAFADAEIERSDSSALSALDWKALNKTQSIATSVGTKFLWAKIVSYDKTAVNYVPLAKMTSNFTPLKNFSATPSTIGNDPSVGFIFDSYADSRADGADGGYILWGKKGKDQARSLDLSDLNSAKDSITDYKNISGSEFLLKIKDLRSGFNAKVFNQNEDWTFRLFAYSGKGSSSTFRSQELAASNVKTALLPKGRLVFYPVYIEAKNDHDGGYSPDYYWTFNSSDFALSDYNLDRNNAKEMSDNGKNGNKYFAFKGESCGSGALSKSEPTPDWTAKKSADFERNKNHTTVIKLEVMDKDYSSADDSLGELVLTLNYNSATDSWTFLEGGTTKTLTTGGGKNSWTLNLANSDGDINFKCFFEWTYVE